MPLFSDSKTFATLVNYTYKTFDKLMGRCAMLLATRGAVYLCFFLSVLTQNRASLLFVIAGFVKP